MRRIAMTNVKEGLLVEDLGGWAGGEWKKKDMSAKTQKAGQIRDPWATGIHDYLWDAPL